MPAKPASTTAYHPYAFMFTNLDAQWTRHYSRDPNFENLSESYLSVMRESRAISVEYRQLLCETNQHEAVENNLYSSPQKLDSKVYNPISFIPFGHGDVISFTLVDDLDPLHYFSSRYRNTVEESGLAFCPDLTRSGITNIGDLIVPPSELFDDFSPHDANSLIHQLQSTHPLLVFTRIKTDGLALLSGGTSIQRSVYQTVVNRINFVYGKLNTAKASAKCAELFSEDDFDSENPSIRITILDLQGQEELGVLIFARNYSLAAAIISGLESLTYGDLLDCQPHPFDQSITDFECYRSVLRHHNSIAGVEEKDLSLEALRPNHIFRWFDSIAGISPQLFLPSTSKDSPKVNGLLFASIDLHIASGHQPNIEIDNSKSNRIPDFRLHTLGGSDYRLHSGDPKSSELKPLNHILESIRSLLMQAYGDSIETLKAKPSNCEGRDILGIMTQLTIPVPTILDDSGEVDCISRCPSKEHFAPISQVMRRLQKVAFDDESEAASNDNAQLVSFKKVQKATKHCGMPVSLRRTIELLCQNFSTLFTNPILFDVILDLYDPFFTFYRIITVEMPRRHDSGSCFKQRDWEDLATYAEYLQKALEDRLYRTYPESPLRDMAADFRGGLHQLMIAAYAPQRCMLGVLRRYWRSNSSKAKPYHSVGAFSHLGLRPGIKCVAPALGVGRHARIACFHTDLSHLMQVSTFVDYFHEVSHLILECIAQTNQGFKFANLELDSKSCLEEIFVHVMVHLFVFRQESDLFLCHHYASHVANYGPNEPNIDRCLSIQVARLLISVELVNRIVVSQWDLWQEHNDFELSAEAIFKNTKTKYPYFWARLPNSICESLQQSLREVIIIFKKPFRKSFLEELSRCFRIHHRRSVLRSAGIDDFESITDRKQKVESYNNLLDELTTSIERNLHAGITVSKTRLFGTDIKRIDATDFLACVIRAMIRLGQSANDFGTKPVGSTIIKVERERSTDFQSNPGGKISLQETLQKSPNKPSAAELLLDSGSAAKYCCRPAARKRRVQRQIAGLKSLWDLSCMFRSRRLEDLLSPLNHE